MPLEGSYVIWNNRGGSGKTNLTYHLAIKYAYRNPDKTVLVIDMCPQADLSHAFLGKSDNEKMRRKKNDSFFSLFIFQEMISKVKIMFHKLVHLKRIQ